MGEHLNQYKKAYIASILVLILTSFSGDVMVIFSWLVSLTGVTLPPNVEAAFAHIFTAVATGGAVARTTNT